MKSSEKPETVVHIAGEQDSGDEQRCLDCGFLLSHAGSDAHRWPKAWKRGQRVGVRIDETFKEGFIVGYFPVDGREFANGERRCVSRSE